MILARAYEKYSVVISFSEDQTICATHLEVFIRPTTLKHGDTQLETSLPIFFDYMPYQALGIETRLSGLHPISTPHVFVEVVNSI